MSPDLDRIFQALASAPRREMLRRAARGPFTVTELAEHFDMSLAAVSKHVRVLDEAELLRETRDGRLHWRSLNPEPLISARRTLEELAVFWDKQLDGLVEFFSETPGAEDKPRRKRGKSRQRP